MAYVVPDGAGGFTKVAMKGQSPIAIGAGPIGAKTTSQLIGLSDDLHQHRQRHVLHGGGPGDRPAPGHDCRRLRRHRHLLLHRPRHGLRQLADAITGDWNDQPANRCGCLAFNPRRALNGKTLINNSGDTVVPCNKWDAEQLMAWGVKGDDLTGAGAQPPIVDYGDGRGNAPWGFASRRRPARRAATPGTSTGTSGDGSAKDAAAMRAAMGTDEIGPWKRIQYTGDRISYDQPGLISTVLGYASMDAGNARRPGRATCRRPPRRPTPPAPRPSAGPSASSPPTGPSTPGSRSRSTTPPGSPIPTAAPTCAATPSAATPAAPTTARTTCGATTSPPKSR